MSAPPPAGYFHYRHACHHYDVSGPVMDELFRLIPEPRTYTFHGCDGWFLKGTDIEAVLAEYPEFAGTRTRRIRTGPTGRQLRFAVLERDHFTCRYCGRRPPTVVLEVDHVVSTLAGGETIIENLVTACHDCNRGKHMDLTKVVPADVPPIKPAKLTN